MPEPNELNPPAMPQGPKFPISKESSWGDGANMIAKVLKCSDLPAKFAYNEENYYTDHMPSSAAEVSTADEAYAVWKSLKGVWPPTKQCVDDVASLNKVLHSSFANCNEAYSTLQKYVDGFIVTMPRLGYVLSVAVCAEVSPFQMLHLPHQVQSHRRRTSALCVIMSTILSKMAEARPLRTSPKIGSVLCAVRRSLLIAS